MNSFMSLRRVVIVGAALVASLSWLSPPQEPELSPKERKQVDQILKIFGDLSIEGQVAAIQAQRAILSDRLLTPSRTDIRRHAAISQTQGVGINRLLNRGPFAGVLVGRGGGAYFSFTSHENDYNKAPDLQLSRWKLRSGFAGGDHGIIAPLGKVPMDEVTLNSIPGALLLDDANALERSHERPLATVGESYAVRSVRWDEADTLTVVQVLSRDQHGITFAWQVLKTYPTPKRKR